MDEQTLFGVKASLAVFEQRPGAIRRIFYGKDQAHVLGGLLKWAASQRLVYRELPAEELAKVAKSTHHEGLVLITESLRWLEMPEFSSQGSSDQGSSGQDFSEGNLSNIVALDRVENPHNMGAILRSCAFFGVEGVLAGGITPGDKVNAATLRVAEGGAEHLKLFATGDLVGALKSLKKGGRAVLGLETGGQRLTSPPKGPWVLVSGHEHDGLSGAVKAACSEIVEIPGAGRVQSLNVSVATGVALAILLK